MNALWLAEAKSNRALSAIDTVITGGDADASGAGNGAATNDGGDAQHARLHTTSATTTAT